MKQVKNGYIGDIVLTYWSPLHSPSIKYSAYSAKYTVNEAHSFKIKCRKANSGSKIQPSKGMLAFMPFAYSSLGTLNLEAKTDTMQ